MQSLLHLSSKLNTEPSPLSLSPSRCIVQNISSLARMGCTSSISRRYDIWRKKKVSIREVVVFVPTMRVPVDTDILRALRGPISRELAERLSAFRSRIILLAEGTDVTALSELKQSLEDYLPLLIGLTAKEHNLEGMVEFKWKSLGKDKEEICIASSWYEMLSVIHMMAMLTLSEANEMLIPKESTSTCERKASEDCRTVAVDLLLKASGYLQHCIQHILVRLPQNMKARLPKDLHEGILEAISIQALGLGTEMQLALAIESQKATLSVKRRLACEQVNYFAQAHYCLSRFISEGYRKKHVLFIKWKYLEAKAAAYYYHGLILDKGNEPSDHISAVHCLLAADELLINSKKACLSFCLEAPITRAPPKWGVMKHLHQKIPEVASNKSQMYTYLFEQEKAPHELPDLPEFPLSLKPDEYETPDVDPMWYSQKTEPEVQTLKDHLEDEEDEVENR